MHFKLYKTMCSTLIYRNCCWSHLLLFRRCLPTATRWLQDSKNSTIFVSTLSVWNSGTCTEYIKQIGSITQKYFRPRPFWDKRINCKLILLIMGNFKLNLPICSANIVYLFLELVFVVIAIMLYLKCYAIKNYTR